MFGLVLALLLQSEAIQQESLERHVRFLASDEMKGRDNGTPEGLKAAAYIADHLKKAGLRPGGSAGFAHDFTDRAGKGRNVVGRLEGEIPGEFVVVAAHHDGLGVRKGEIRNGADDNASGVAVVLELARVFSKSKPRRSMLFVSFDCEEDGLLGSKAFVASDLYDPKAFVAMFVFDLIGGNFFDWETKRIYAIGSEYSRALFERVGKRASETKEWEIRRSGVFLLEPYLGMARSDYNAFRARGVPFVFFSTGTPWYYHTEHDDADRLNYPKMVAAARFARRVIQETVRAPERPDFRRPGIHAENIGHVRETLSRVLENRERLKIGEKRLAELRTLHGKVAGMKEPDAKLLQRAMIVLFGVARSRGER